MHKVLEQQLHKYLPEYPNVSQDILRLIDDIERTYESHDRDTAEEDPSGVTTALVNENNAGSTNELQLLQGTIDSLQDAVYVMTSDFRFVAYNRRFVDLWDIPDEVIKTKDGRKIYPAMADKIVAPEGLITRVQEIYTNRRASSTDILIGKDGRIIERKSFPITVLGFIDPRVWVSRDITESENTKQATINMLEDIEHEKNLVEERVQERTRELAEEHARFAASIRSIPFGLLVFDEKNHISIRNRVARNLLRMEALEYTIEDIERLLPETHFVEKVTQCHHDHMPVDLKDIEVGKKTIRILISAMSTGLEREADVPGVVVLIEDTTEARALERGRDEFFAIAAHELRTPLTAIRGNLSMIEDYYQEAITNKEVFDMIRDTDAAAQRLITIVNDFLDMSRLEQGHIALMPSDFSASELAGEVIKGLSEVATQKGISLHISDLDVPIVVHADRDRSKQVLTNLVSNAINYSERGTVEISITKDGGHAEFSVRDEGIGIPTQNQSLLFRKFQQAGESVLSRDMTQSTGLGLYISRLIIEPMGGKIWMKRSVAGEGSTFAFTLPLASGSFENKSEDTLVSDETF